MPNETAPKLTAALSAAPPDTVRVETPSGKGAGDENFPVGSWLLPGRLRPHVARYYAFARAIDDIADNPDLTPEDKVRRLELFAAAVTGRERQDPALVTAHRLRASLAETGVGVRHATDLVAAFKQDATKLRYRDWADLLGYCEFSANPVGRYLLDLHGEDPAGYPASDALCSALQVINHLQDCAEDYRNLDRVYLPRDWLEDSGITVADLRAPAAGPGLRRVLDRCLDGVEDLMAVARGLPGCLKSLHLAMESAVIVRLADKLTVELRRRDPLAERVVLSKPQVGMCACRGVAAVLWQRLSGRRGAPGQASVAPGGPSDHVHEVVRRSGTSFLWGMRILPKARRETMFAIYAFCREVDDVADEPGEPAAKLAELEEWRAEIARLYEGRPSRPTTLALASAVEAYGLPRDEFLAVIDGMEMDAREVMVAPAMADFERYCRRVAGAVGMLSIHAFGARGPAAREIAVTLGEALQITNILRDLAEDAACGRLYLPRELLEAQGIETADPRQVLDHPGLVPVSAELAAMARARFSRTRVLIGACDPRPLKPCILMMQVYERILERLEARGWDRPEEPVRVSKAEKLWIAVRYGLF